MQVLVHGVKTIYMKEPLIELKKCGLHSSKCDLLFEKCKPHFFCFAKTGCTSEIKINAFILYFSRFALLCFAKIGFTSDVLLSDSEK